VEAEPERGPRVRETEIAIIGAGAAGLSLAYRLAALPRPPEVVLVDAPPGPLRPPARTWCFWEEPGGPYDTALTARWERLRVRGPDGAAVVRSAAPLEYKMLRSASFEELVARRLDRCPQVRRTQAAVREVRPLPGGAEVRGTGPDGEPLKLRARWVYDSRPPRALPAARTTLLQHFLGWFVRTEEAVFEPGVADLMDFDCPQPARGLAFVYLLPLSASEALVEYTVFSRAPLPQEAYEEALRGHLTRRHGRAAYAVAGVERGVIPMTDGRFPRRLGEAVFAIGTAGGATRPATGYTFAAVQRQARAVAEAYAAGRAPVPPAAYPARAGLMDAVLLRGLDTGRVDGPRALTGLFRSVPTERLLRFLDGATGLREDLAIGLRMPVPPMLRTLVELPLLRRTTPGEEAA